MRCAADSPGSPGDATDVRPDRPLPEGGQETQAGIYSHEPACPNAEFQGEFTPPDVTCEFWLARCDRPSGEPARASATTRSSRAAAAIRGRRRRPSRPTWTARSSARRCASTHDFGGATFTSITDYQTSEKFYTEGGDASPDEGVYFFQGSDLDQVSQEFRLSWTAGDHQFVARRVRHGGRRRLHRQVRRPVLRLRPGRRVHAGDDLLRGVLPGRVELQRALEADRRPALLARHARGLLLRHARRKCRA